MPALYAIRNFDNSQIINFRASHRGARRVLGTPGECQYKQCECDERCAMIHVHMSNNELTKKLRATAGSGCEPRHQPLPQSCGLTGRRAPATG